MKSSAFALFLTDFSKMLYEYSADRPAECWAKLASVFELAPTANVANVCKSIAAVRPDDATGTPVEDFLRGMPNVVRAIEPFAKKALIDDLAALVKSLEQHRSLSIEAVVSSAIELNKSQSSQRARAPAGADLELVRIHLSHLESAFGDEAAFVLAYNALKQDKAVKALEAKKLAREFAKEAATSKPHALKLIWGRHATLMEARAKAAATAGRTAA